jgi:hypothetical protein
MSAGKRSDRISLWLVQLKERVGWQKAVAACSAPLPEPSSRGLI